MLNRQTFLRTSALVIGTALLLKLLGLAEKLVLAERFGVGPAADAALIGTTAALLLGYLLHDVVGSALVPVLMGRDARDQRRIVGTLLALLVLALAPLAALGWWQGRALLLVLAPGFDAETRSLALYVLRGGLIGMPALGLAAVVTAYLNANGRYLQPAAAELLLKLGPVAGLLLVGGLEGLAAGLAIGALLRLALLYRPGLTPGLAWAPNDAGVRRVLDLAWPLFLTSLISTQLFALIEAAIASTVGIGVVSALAYARRIADLPIALVPQVAARVALPTLSGLAVEPERLRGALGRSLEATLALLLPPALLGMLLADPVVRLLYARGAFDAAAVEATTAALWALLPGMPALGLQVIVVRFAYALRDTRGPSVLRLAGLLLHIALALALRPWGVAGIAWSSTITLWIEALALIGLVAVRLGLWRRLPAGAWPAALRTCAGGGLMVLAAALLDGQLPAGDGLPALLLRLSAVGACGVAVYALVLFLLRPRRPAG